MSTVNLLRGMDAPDHRCYCVWLDELKIWECSWCGFSTASDEEAQLHGMTGMEQLLDEAEVPD